MDIKRVAFETKPVYVSKTHNVDATSPSGDISRKRPNRAEISAIVDSFLSQKLREIPPPEKPVPDDQPVVKTIVHEITPENAVQKPVPVSAVDFVSEDDVRKALEKGEKIYISKKTIVTPSARDLGQEKEIFSLI